MNVLILGANGYLGSKVTVGLVKEFGNKEDRIVCTKREHSDISRLDNVVDRIQFITVSNNEISDCFSEQKYDIVINMACHYEKQGTLLNDITDANLTFPMKVLNQAIENNTGRFLTIGTAMPDDFNTYSLTKAMFGKYGRYCAKKHGIDFYDLKLQMFYGADEPGDRFLPRVIRDMLVGKEINVTKGTQKRDIISVTDVVNAIIAVIKCNLQGYEQIPVGTGVAPSVADIIDYIWLQTGKKSIINKGAVPMRLNEPDCVADTSILGNLCDWNPSHWQSGLKSMINILSDVYQ